MTTRTRYSHKTRKISRERMLLQITFTIFVIDPGKEALSQKKGVKSFENFTLVLHNVKHKHNLKKTSETTSASWTLTVSSCWSRSSSLLLPTTSSSLIGFGKACDVTIFQTSETVRMRIEHSYCTCTMYNRMEWNYTFVKLRGIAGRDSEMLLENMFSYTNFFDELKKWGYRRGAH